MTEALTTAERRAKIGGKSIAQTENKMKQEVAFIRTNRWSDKPQKSGLNNTIFFLL